MSVQRAIDDVQSRLQDGLAFLATVGSTAPFVGLFGTVWGIYHALTAIGIAGQASIDKVAGPVGEALIMTAIGLAVAVPAVLGYNWLVRRNKVTMEAVRRFGADLHGVLMGAQVDAADGALSTGARHGHERRLRGRRRGRSRLRHQHHAARRRDAGAADHLPDHDPGGHADDRRCSCRRKPTSRAQTKPENIDISVNKDGDIFWNDAARRRHRRAVPAPEEDRGDEAAARSAHPRRRQGALRIDRPGRLRVPARGDRRRSASSPNRRRRAERRRRTPWQ